MLTWAELSCRGKSKVPELEVSLALVILRFTSVKVNIAQGILMLIWGET